MYADVSEAVDTQLVAEATGRNALYKIHVSLGKIVNNLDTAQEAGFGRRSVSRATSVSMSVEDRTVVPEDKTVLLDTDIKEEDEDEGQEGGGSAETTIMPDATVIRHEEEDSLVDDLLTDGDGEE